MSNKEFENRRQQEAQPTSKLREVQLASFNRLLSSILPANEFYATKLGDVSLPLSGWDEFQALPQTFKRELQSQTSDFANNRTYPLSEYTRFHRTSGTHGRPLIVLDTRKDWQWWIETWQFVLDAAKIQTDDRVLMAFSFGPFIGFWSANDALVARGAMVIPAGGLSSIARLELIETSQATVICCTPSYALHLSEVAKANGIDLTNNSVTRIIVAGEPGGSVPTIRKRIEERWSAKLIDHSGASEVGPWGYANADGTGLFIVESQFIAEFESVTTGSPAESGELSELIITTLGRIGSPLIRYRTGDLVRPKWAEGQFVFLEGGVLGRADDMLVIRGVNVFPSAIEQILCGFPEVAEYRMTAFKNGEMDAIRVEVEDALDDPTRISQELNLRLGLNVQVDVVPPQTLPRFEAKGKRFVDQRNR